MDAEARVEGPSCLWFPPQELMQYICLLEQKTGTVSSAKRSAAPVLFPGERTWMSRTPPAACAIKVWSIASPAALPLLRVTHIIPDRSSMPGHTDHFYVCVCVWLCLRGRPTRQRDLRLRGRESRGSAAPPSAQTSGKLRPVRAGRARFLAPHHPSSSFAQRDREECGRDQPAGAADLAAPGQRRHGRAQFGFGENPNLSQSQLGSKWWWKRSSSW